jgi:DNA gyrase subunit A
MTGIKMKPGDQVVGMEVVEPGGDLLIVTSQGQGKRTSLDEYPVKGRATMGVLTIDRHAIVHVGKIAVARVVQAEEDLITLISSHGIVMRTKAESIAQMGRATRGVRVMDMQEGDSVAALARFSAADLRRVTVDHDEDESADPAGSIDSAPPENDGPDPEMNGTDQPENGS